jgi:carboxyl-terminal processing protease
MLDYVFDILAHRYSSSFLEKNLSVFNITSTDYRDFVKYAAQNKKILIDPVQLAEARPLIFNDLKTLLYRYHLGDAGYYKALNMNDMAVKQAINSLH